MLDGVFYRFSGMWPFMGLCVVARCLVSFLWHVACAWLASFVGHVTFKFSKCRSLGEIYHHDFCRMETQDKRSFGPQVVSDGNFHQVLGHSLRLKTCRAKIEEDSYGGEGRI